MNKINDIKLDEKTNWIEVAWVNGHNEIIHCESFGDSDEYIDVLNQICNKLDTPLSEKEKEVLMEQKANRYIPTSEEVKQQKQEENKKLEEIRILSINSKSNQIIESKYPIYKQNNIMLLLTPYTEIDLEDMKMFMETVRGIAKNAKENNIAFDEIDWADLDK